MNAASPSWRSVASMNIPRRHVNSTLLPDGTVLVSGGYVSGAIFDYFASYRVAFLNGLAWNLINLAVVAWPLMRARPRLATA